MKHQLNHYFFILFFLLFGYNVAFGQSTEKMVIVIIDGARYTETFGDLSKTYTPKMWELAKEGTYIDDFANNGYTYTSRAIPALWCGAWTDVEGITYNGSQTNYAVLPTIFEYYRKQKQVSEDDCVYVLKYIPSIWLPSFDPDFGPDYWPSFHSVGSTDKDVATEAQMIMDNSHPNFLLVYLADVDHEGHSGDWQRYTQAIHTADSLVDVLWQKIESDPFYKGKTTMIVTNDHGRHDDEHGGFTGHGCSCNGCRQIQFLALGPSIKKDYVSNQYRNIPDMAVTAAYLLGIETTKTTGNVMHEIFDLNAIDEKPEEAQTSSNFPNPFHENITINYYISKATPVKLTIYSLSGEEVITLVDENQMPGAKNVIWNAMNKEGQKVSPGVYFYGLQIEGASTSGKLVLLDD